MVTSPGARGDISLAIAVDGSDGPGIAVGDGSRRAGVTPQPAVHLPMPSHNDQHVTPEDAEEPRGTWPELPLSVAYVPFFSEDLSVYGSD